MTLTPVAERLAVELSLPVFTTYVCRDQGSMTNEVFFYFIKENNLGLSMQSLINNMMHCYPVVNKSGSFAH